MIKVNNILRNVSFILFVTVSISYASTNENINTKKDYLIGRVKIPIANYRTKPYLNNKYLMGQYKKGTLLELESCIKYDWYKIKDQDLDITKLNTSLFIQTKYKIKSPNVIENV